MEVTSDDCQELVNVERLDQEIRSARREEFVDGHRVRVAAEDDDRDRGGGGGSSKLEQDLLAGCQKLLDETSKLVDANSDLGGALDDARLEVVQTSPTAGRRSPP